MTKPGSRRALVELLRGTEEQRGADGLVAVVRAELAARPFVLVARDASPDGPWRVHTLAIDGGLGTGSPDELFRSADSARALSPAHAEACAAAVEPTRFASSAPAWSGAPVDFAGPLLVVPLLRDGVAQASLLIPAAAVDAWSEADIDRLWLSANLAATTLDEQRRRQRLEQLEAQRGREMGEVARIQQRLLPDAQHGIRGVEIAARLESCELAGGDYYDYMPLTHHFRDPAGTDLDVFGVMVADVTGHGVAAAVEAAMFDALLRTYRGTRGPDAVLTYANQNFFSRQGRSHLITAFSAAVHPEADELRYANAGHPPALLKRAADGALEWLDEPGGIPIGVLPDFEWELGTRRFEVGDVLVLYTDGVVEAHSETGEHFGAERLGDVVREGPDAPEALLEAIRLALAQHRGAAPPRDDTTLVVLRRTLA